ncbi:putative protease [Serinicoccus hydrothermalis]|uniref:Tricorn protease homolog n=1 Tax=Serinicoccus hydrothermalis TaxID=1758689 RepID=A0A1B1NGK6_9MICO|nr:S41 family peptidase [Serinicoccus hydrothermalis]ANS80555.1 putative protease [Serinicoccus hydrothermalis]
MSNGYLRYPHVHDDLVTFVADDDLWIAPVDGGRAWRLTADHEPARCPRFSRDGAHIAYVSHRDGHPEVMVVEVATAAARRLTWWGGSVALVLGWSEDGRVLVASNAGESNMRHAVVKAVGLDGSVERLPWGSAWGVAVRGDGTVALSTVGSRVPAQWKRYRGGTAPRLWLDEKGKGDWSQLLADEPASLVDPMWVGDELLFVSDRAATFPDHAHEQANLWAWKRPGGTTGRLRKSPTEPRQLTHQGEQEGYVRDASTDGTRVVWHSRGDLWLLDSLAATPRRIEVDLPVGPPAGHTVPAAERLDHLDVDRGGDASLVGTQGASFWVSHRSGPVRALVADSAVRTREPIFLGQDGSRAVLVTDADGEDALEVHTLDGSTPPRRLVGGELGRVLHLAASPDGSRVATVSHDGAMRVLDASSGAVREVGRSRQGEALTPRFSPDSRYLVWSQPTSGEGEHHQVVLLDVRTEGEPVALTSGRYHDRDPDFTRDGAAVVFLSDRTFDPTYDAHEFALSFTGATRPWLVPLAADRTPPFGPSLEGWRISEVQEDKRPGGDAATDAEDKSTDEAAAPPASPDLDAEGAEQRITPFPVPSADYRDLRAAKDGVLWVHVAGDSGVLGTRRSGVEGEPATDSLEFYSFTKRTLTTVADAVDDYQVSGDGERAVVHHKESLHVQPADRKPEDGDEGGADKVSVDLERVRVEVEPRVRWHQMFDENARIMRDHFWRADMDGVDWAATTQRWRPLVERLATHDDLQDVLWETVGELNTSHAYVTPPHPPGDLDRRLGLLGADLSPEADGWRIDRILPGESSDPNARSPLQAAGVGAQVGDVVVAVDGRPVDPAAGPAPLLVGAADKPVQLTLRRDGQDRRVVVVPIGDEEVLRYQDWVASRRAYVEEKTGGRLGYVHIPDMMSVGWAQLHRDLHHATRAEGLVVDVRYNRGGHTSQLVLARLAARVVGWAPARYYEAVGSYPEQAPRGPVVLVANQHSGSDGDIVNAGAQAMGLGPVVGVRTWGGVVGIDGRFDLVDGTAITQPRYAFWLEGKGFGVENHGVDPDIEVVHSPADTAHDRDRQLDRAIEEALAQLAQTPAAAPPELPEPKVRG